MRTWLVEGATSVLLFVLLVPLATGPFLGFVYRRYRWAAPAPTAVAALSGLYACAVVAFTTFPLPRDPLKACRYQDQFDYWQLTPFASLDDVVTTFREVGVLQGLMSGAFLQVFFNVLFFVPLGVAVAYVLRRSALTALVSGLGVSLLIEATQGTALWGLYPCPYRLADVDDLMTNTLGALLGWALGTLLHRVVPYRRPSPREDLAPPTTRRRVAAAVIDLTGLWVVSLAVGVGLALFALSAGREPSSYDDPLTVVTWVVGIIWLLVVPCLRSDRATPGQATVLLGVESSRERRPAPRWSMLVVVLVRWAPIVLFWGGSNGLLLLVATVELVTVWVRRDDRGLASVVARVVTRTHDAMATHDPRVHSTITTPLPKRWRGRRSPESDGER